MSAKELLLFVIGPRLLADVWVQMVVPPATPASVQQTVCRTTATARCAHRSRHCLPIRPGRCDEMNDHFFAPCSATSSRTLSSSSLRQGPLTRSGLSTCTQAPANFSVPSVRDQCFSTTTLGIPSASDASTGRRSCWRGSPQFSSSCDRRAASPSLAAGRPAYTHRESRRGAVRLPARHRDSDGCSSTPPLASSTTLSSPAPAHSVAPSSQPHTTHSTSPPPPPPPPAAAAAAAARAYSWCRVCSAPTQQLLGRSTAEMRLRNAPPNGNRLQCPHPENFWVPMKMSCNS